MMCPVTGLPDLPPRLPVKPSLFLARDSYRQRRLRDAAWMLPVLGAVIWLVPLLWQRGPGQTGGMAAAVVFVFSGWMVLIVLTALIARKLRPDDSAAIDPGTAP
jgi:predicted membrane channel-forming protein YqfA (hemolysin III family)